LLLFSLFLKSNEFLQTLIFENIELYGEPDEIHHNPPNVLIELFDKDEYVIENRNEFEKKR